MMKVRSLPRTKFASRASHAAALSARAFRPMADEMAMVHRERLVPERQSDGHDLDDVTHKRKDGTNERS